MNRNVSLLLLLVAATFAGCATSPIPKGYTGPKATITDSLSTRSSSQVGIFMVSRVNGQMIDNTSQATAGANRGMGMGFAFTKVISREVPAQKLSLKIEGLTRSASDFQAMFATSLTVSGNVPNPELISLGDHVWLGPGCFITAVKEYPSPSLRHPEKHTKVHRFTPRIRIGARVTSSGNLILGAARQIDIGDDVLLAFNVTILDNMHGFENPYEPYKYQALQRIAPVEVGPGCWLGQNVVILPSVKIGEMSIIGANSVVTADIPARSIAVGAPARVIKQWDEKSHQWRPCARPDACQSPIVDAI